MSLGPYHLSRMEALGGLGEFEVTGIGLSRSEALREWTVPESVSHFSYQYLDPGQYEQADKRVLEQRVVKRLEELQPDAVVVSGYGERPMRAAARWAHRHNRVSILMSESQRLDRRRLLLKEALKGWWIRRNFDAAFVGGERTTAYLEELGLPRERIWRGYDVVNGAHFARAAERVRARAALERARLDLPAHYFLYVGRFAPEKNLSRLLDAYRHYRVRAGAGAWDLVLVGSGPLDESLRRQAGQDAPGVHFHGFKQIDEISAYYALASCFVLPSTSEPWGLVINEAMAAGLPLLVSNRCGAVGDLVFPGVNGYVFDPFDVEGLSRLMERISSHPGESGEMAVASRRIIAPYTLDTWAKALANCISVTLWRKTRMR